MSRKFLKARAGEISHIQQISPISRKLVQKLVQNSKQAKLIFSIEENEPLTERSIYTAFRHKREYACVESA